MPKVRSKPRNNIIIIMQNLKQVRDKMAQYGLNAMTNDELLSAAKFKGSIEDFYASFEYKATKELIRRRDTPEKLKIRSSLDTYNIMSFLNNEEEESFYMITINRSNRVINTTFISKGNDYATIVGLKQIAAIAIKEKACCVILCHNHPSGNNKPSREDISITEKIKEGLKLFDITLLDHVIIARDNYHYSFADEGIL